MQLVIFFAGLIVGGVLGFVIARRRVDGYLLVDDSNPAKTLYRFQLDRALYDLKDKQKYILKVKEQELTPSQE